MTTTTKMGSAIVAMAKEKEEIKHPLVKWNTATGRKCIIPPQSQRKDFHSSGGAMDELVFPKDHHHPLRYTISDPDWIYEADGVMWKWNVFVFQNIEVFESYWNLSEIVRNAYAIGLDCEFDATVKKFKLVTVISIAVIRNHIKPISVDIDQKDGVDPMYDEVIGEIYILHLPTLFPSVYQNTKDLLNQYPTRVHAYPVLLGWELPRSLCSVLQNEKITKYGAAIHHDVEGLFESTYYKDGNSLYPVRVRGSCDLHTLLTSSAAYRVLETESAASLVPVSQPVSLVGMCKYAGISSIADLFPQKERWSSFTWDTDFLTEDLMWYCACDAFLSIRIAFQFYDLLTQKVQPPSPLSPTSSNQPMTNEEFHKLEPEMIQASQTKLGVCELSHSEMVLFSYILARDTNQHYVSAISYRSCIIQTMKEVRIDRKEAQDDMKESSTFMYKLWRLKLLVVAERFEGEGTQKELLPDRTPNDFEFKPNMTCRLSSSLLRVASSKPK